MDISDNNLRILENILSMVFGASTPIIIQWVMKKKTKKEQAQEEINANAQAAKINLEGAQDVIEMFKQLVEEQRIHFDNRLQSAKDQCTSQIQELKSENRIELDEIRLVNEALKADNEAMNIKITNLRERLSKYESVITGKHKSVTKQDIEDSKK